MKTFRLPHFSTWLGIIVLTAILVGDRILITPSFHEPVSYTVPKTADLLMPVDKVVPIGKVKKGETVQYFGVLRGDDDRPIGILVQTASGERGVLTAPSLGFPKRAVLEEDDEEDDLRNDKITCILPPELPHWDLREKGDYYMSVKKFERLYIGATFEENEARYRPAFGVVKEGKATYAYYPNIELVNFDNGEIYNPVVQYDAQGVAVAYTFSPGSLTNNRMLILLMPKLSSIIDNDFFARFIAGSVYHHAFTDEMDNFGEYSDNFYYNHRWLLYVRLFFMVLVFLCWMIFMVTLPSLILEAGLYCRWIYYFLPDKLLSLLFFLVAAVWTYIWVGLTVVWGFLTLFVLLTLFVALCGWIYSQRMLATRPAKRCPTCRRMEVNKFRDRKLIREYNQWRPEAVVNDSHTHRWETWTEVTTKYAYGNTYTSRKNVQSHSRTTTTYSDYNVLYHVKEYISYYECMGCHHVEEIPDEQLQELKREFKGKRTEVTTT